MLHCERSVPVLLKSTTLDRDSRELVGPGPLRQLRVSPICLARLASWRCVNKPGSSLVEASFTPTLFKQVLHSTAIEITEAHADSSNNRAFGIEIVKPAFWLMPLNADVWRA